MSGPELVGLGSPKVFWGEHGSEETVTRRRGPVLSLGLLPRGKPSCVLAGTVTRGVVTASVGVGAAVEVVVLIWVALRFTHILSLLFLGVRS